MLESLTPIQLGLATAIVLLAYLVRGITSFGSGLIAIPLLALMLPLPVVVPVVGLLDYTAAVSHGVKHRRSISWRDILPLLPFTLTGVATALFIFKTVDAAVLARFLGGFVLLYALHSLFGRQPHGNGSRRWAAPTGLFAGLFSALFGTGGPIYVMYLHLRGLSKTAFRATAATIFLLDGSTRIVGYFISGFYTMDVVRLVLAGLPLMAVAMLIGGRIHTTIAPETFRRWIGIVLIGSGMALLLR